jgi:TorA maturation chaperone TorD
MQTSIDLSELAKARAQLYHLQASLYSAPPEAKCLKFLADSVHAQINTDSFSIWLSGPVKESLRKLDDFFNDVSEKSWEELEEIVSVEHTRLFRGVKQNYSPPPPYESVYVEEEGRVFGDVSIQVQSIYRQFGVDLIKEMRGEPPDHLSLELEFMYSLCEQEADAWKRGNEDEAHRLISAEKNFLEEHLMAWLPAFSAKQKRFNRIGFFSGLVDLTESWTIFDYQEHLRDAELP